MRTIALALAATACFATAQVALAGGDGGAPSCCGEVRGTPNCCNQCGCCSPCKKVCRVVCEMKEEKITCWEVECEDFCVPMPRLDCGSRCGGSCGSSCCAPEAGCCGNDNRVTPPKCGHVRCKKKLVKREVTKQVPVYKCVVEYVCNACCGGGCGVPAGEAVEAAQPTQAAPVPAAPQPPKAPRPKGT